MSMFVGVRGPAVSWVAVMSVLLWSASSATAQQVGSIRGLVTDGTSNRPVSSAQVFVVGTQLGAITGANGRFVINNVPVGTRELSVRLIGFRGETRQVTVVAGQEIEVRFSLAAAPFELDEVVVTGQAGVATRRDVGTSIGSIGRTALELAPVGDLTTVLNAQTAGLQQLQEEGQVGGGTRIMLRGLNSVTQDVQPLIYIDGIRMNNNQGIYGNRSGRNPGAEGAQTTSNPLDNLNPDDIDRIEVVRGAAAATLYGTEAAGGVIQIFTKRGRRGQGASWDVKVTGGNRFMRGNNFGNVIGKTENWGFLRPHMNNGPLFEADVSVSGGTEAVGYFLSTGYDVADGVVRNNQSERYNLRGNFNFTPVQGLRFDLATSYGRRETDYVENGDNAEGLVLNVLRGTQDYLSTEGGDSLVYDIKDRSELDHFVGGLTVTHAPTEALSNRLTIGLDYQAAFNRQDIPFNWRPSFAQGVRNMSRWQHRTLTLDYAGNWSQNITGSLESRFSWGGQIFSDWDHLLFGLGEDFGGPGNKTVSSGARKVADEEYLKVVNAGFFFQEVVGLSDRFFITGGLRIDGNSAFGEALGLQAYPKVSLSYVASEMESWPSWWPVMKLRAAYGESGKAPGAFDAVRTWDPVAGYEARPGVTPANLGNPDLGPERSKEIELGFESSLLDDRLGVEFTWYRSRTADALFGVTEPPSQGFLNPQLRNVGEIENRGVELTVNGTPIASDILRWDLTGIISTTKSKVLNLGGAPEFFVGWGSALGQWIREGYPVVALFGPKVVNANETADPIFEADQFYGPVYPTRNLSFSTTLNLAQRFTFNARGEYAAGHYQLNIMPWQQARRGLWPECTDRGFVTPGQVPADAEAIWRARCTRNANGAIANLFDQWIRPADFFKLRTMSLTVQLPDGLIPTSTSSSFTVLAANVFKWTKAPGLDPELTAGHQAFGPFPARYEYYQLPPPTMVTFTLRASF